MKQIAIFLLLLSVAVAPGCGSMPKEIVDQDPADRMLAEIDGYKSQLKANPRDVEALSRLRQAELDVAEHFYWRGSELMRAGNAEQAVAEFQRGLRAMPSNAKLAQALGVAVNHIEANTLYQQGMRNLELGELLEAERTLSEALELAPEHALVAEALETVRAKLGQAATGQPPLSSVDAPVTLNFKRTDTRTVYEFLGKAFDINIIYDEGLKDAPVTLFAKDVTLEQGLELVAALSQTFYRRIGPNTILVTQDSAQKRAQFEEYVIKTFYLQTAKAKDVASIIKGVLAPKQMIVNESLNALVVRDTEAMLSLVEKTIGLNDMRPAEAMLDVEILEVSRSKLEQLGIDYGSRISINFPQAASSLGKALRGDTVTLPAVTLHYLKQDVDARTLANPKLRVLHGSASKIHIGDRVPLRSSTIQDATGQVRTTFEYRDIGIRLSAEPQIQHDNSVLVKLGLEVSSLGQNLGTQNEPAYSIGTRNAETMMLLRDGETAVLGGLIRDEDRLTTARVPGLGSIPIIGRLFTVDDDQQNRTEVLLTITPRVVRSWDVPRKDLRTVYSGTEKLYLDGPLFPQLATSSGRPSIRVDGNAPALAAPAQVAPSGPVGDQAPVATLPSAPEPVSTPSEARPQSRPTARPATGGSAATSGADAAMTLIGAPRGDSAPRPTVAAEKVAAVEEANTSPAIAFGSATYATTMDGEVAVVLVRKNFTRLPGMKFQLLFNPKIVEFVRIEPLGGSAVDQAGDDRGQSGTIALEAGAATAPRHDSVQPFARAVFRGKAAGASYLAYRLTRDGAEAVPDDLQTEHSRVVVK